MLAPADTLDPHRQDVIAARSGDADAIARLWEMVLPMAKRRAQITARRYAWLDADDLENSVLLKFPRMVEIFDLDGKNPFKKYVYFSLVNRMKDVLRREDPLGIRYPQKRHYPEWHRLGDECFDGFDQESAEQEPLQNLIDAEGTADTLFLEIAHLDAEITERKADLDAISQRNLSKRQRPQPQVIKKRKFSRTAIEKKSLRKFLRRKKLEKRKLKKMEEQKTIAHEQAPDQATEQAVAPKKPGKGWMKGKKRPVKKAVSAESSASDQLQLAMKFANAAGGLKKATALLEQLAALRS